MSAKQKAKARKDELIDQVLAESGIDPESVVRYYSHREELEAWVDGGVRKRASLEKVWRGRYADHQASRREEAS